MSNSTNTEIVLAGSLAAFTVDLLVYPLDTLKTRIQSQDYIKTYAQSSSRLPPKHALRGLYQGVGSVIVATLPAGMSTRFLQLSDPATFFTVYESTKSLLRTSCPSSTPQPVIHSIASATAELSSCLILTPAEVIKQNAQMIRRQPEAGSAAASTSLRAFRMLQASEGGVLRRLWSGYTALAARNLPFTALQFPAFEAIRGRVWTWRDRRATRKEIGGVVSGQGIVETGVVNGLSAATSGAFAAALTTPTDVVKTRMMLSASDEGQGRETRTAGRRKGTRMSGFQVARLVYHERGIRGLFRGGVFRMAWTAVGSGLYLGTYEAAKVWLKGSKTADDDVT